MRSSLVVRCFTEEGLMDTKEAIARAKAYAKELFGPEGWESFRLEEIDFDHSQGDWLVTVSIARPREGMVLPLSVLDAPLSEQVFKLVRISGETGAMKSITNRLFQSAA
jgi:hypothetical protein